LALKQRLITNAERARRGAGTDSACEVCGHGSEDVLYMLKDCPAARNIWSKLILADKLSNFYSISLYEWMIENLLNQNWVYLSIDGLVRTEDGFTAAGGFGYERVLIQIDSLEVVNAIQDESLRGSNSTHIWRIHQLLEIARN
ncbi:hypothetical protein Gogos_020404, partial [Gossypium gossypioides]|nr:hypothetical protein [Gossypium gossypioides]